MPNANLKLQESQQQDQPLVLKHLDRLSFLLDNSIRIPVLGYRIGLDALIGLVPGLGDAVGLAFSAYIIIQASRFGIPRATVVKMLLNTGLETLAGFVPLIGDVFDATWKANSRNMYLLRRHLGAEKGIRPPSNRKFALMLVIVIAVILILAGLVVFGILSALAGLLKIPIL